MISKITDLYGGRKLKQTGLGLLNNADVILKPILKRTNYHFPYYVWKAEYRAKFHTERILSQGIGKRMSQSHLEQTKSSDTLFILGSGGSINQITEDQWEHIGEKDSIGLNKWPIHEFQPDYHVFEPRMEKEEKERYWQLLNYKRDLYKEIPIILKDTDAVSALNQEDLPNWLSNELLISSDTNYRNIISLENRQNNRDVLRYLKSKGCFEKGQLQIPLYRNRGSVSYLLHLAVGLGYEEIVLCGVDMVNSKYFYNDEKYLDSEIPIPDRRCWDNDNEIDVDSVHDTVDDSIGELTLFEVILDMKEIVLNDEDIELYVENDISSLYNEVPLYNYP
jgi:hypothetical protein